MNPHDLISRYLDRSISDRQFQTLTAWIRASDDNAADFVRATWDHSVLREIYQVEDVRGFFDGSLDDGIARLLDVNSVDKTNIAAMLAEESLHKAATAPTKSTEDPLIAGAATLAPAPCPVQRRRNEKTTWLAVAGATAASLIGMAIGSALNQPASPDGKPRAVAQAPAPESVARIVDSVRAEWGSPGLPSAPGADLLPGELVLTEGIVELEFARGARLVVQSPARFNLLSHDRVHLAYGKAVGKVPRGAVGFAIETPSAVIIDLGTEFGVDAHASGTAEVHVLEGVVEVVPGGLPGSTTSNNVRLTKGSAVRVRERGEVNAIEMNERVFHRSVPRVVSVRAEVFASVESRLVDEDGDGAGDLVERLEKPESSEQTLGDPALVYTVSGVGEKNSPREPDSGERRYFVQFDFPSESFGNSTDPRLVEKATLSFCLAFKIHTSALQVDLFGMREKGLDGTLPGAFEALGDPIQRAIFRQSTPVNEQVVVDVTDYVKACLSRGETEMRFRLQASGGAIPNNNGQTNSYALHTSYAKRSDCHPRMRLLGARYDPVASAAD